MADRKAPDRGRAEADERMPNENRRIESTPPQSGPDGSGPKEVGLKASDGHAWSLLARVPAQPRLSLLWLPALGVAARHYLPFAEALAARGVAVFLHEWRGNGSSNLRAGRKVDWGYRQILLDDLPASEAAAAAALPGVARAIGGHSLGGQLACVRLGLMALHGRAMPEALWLVASGSPYWRTWPMPRKLGLSWMYRFLPWLAQVNGTLPGRRIGFGGSEARGLIRDWARTGLSGRYAAHGVGEDLEAGMARVEIQARSVRLDDDWLVPRASQDYLLSKLPRARAESTDMDARELGARADHFAWMKQPEAVVAALLRDRSA